MIISFVGGHVPMQAGGLATHLPLMSVLKEGQNNLQEILQNQSNCIL